MKKLTLKELDQLILEIEQNALLLNALEPVNLVEEQEKFFNQNYDYNPQFQYKLLDMSKYKEKLEDIEIDEDNEPIKKLYTDKINFLSKRIELMGLIGTNPAKFTQLSIELFGKPNSDLFLTAQNIIKIHKDETYEKKEIYPEQIIDKVQTALDDIKLDTKIELVDSHSNKMKVNHHLNKIFIPKGKSREEDSLNGAIRHEVYTHLQRAVNGKKQKHGIFFNSTAYYLSTEEGLATLMGNSIMENKFLKRAAKLFLAIHYSLSNDFKSTFKKLYELERKPISAFKQTLRAKRGISDTSIPGAFTKDLYFQWTIELGKKLVNNPELLKYIFNGKATVEELREYTEPVDKSILTIDEIKDLFKVNQINL